MVVFSLDDGCPEVLFLKDWSLIWLTTSVYQSLSPFLGYSPSVHKRNPHETFEMLMTCPKKDLPDCKGTYYV